MKALLSLFLTVIATSALAAGNEPAATPYDPAQPLEPDHSVAEAWKQGTLMVGFVSLALAAAPPAFAAKARRRVATKSGADRAATAPPTAPDFKASSSAQIT